MFRIFGILKILVVFVLDFIFIYAIFRNFIIASIAVGAIAIYSVLGSYISILKECAVRLEKLPTYQRKKLEAAVLQLKSKAKTVSGVDVSKIKLFVLTADRTMNAKAYGANCIAVTLGTLEQADINMISGILAHEVSHTLNLDAEFYRAIFCSMMLVLGMFNVISILFSVLVFMIFVIANFFSSLSGFLAFEGVFMFIRGTSNALRNLILIIYKTLMALASRHFEYRSDKYSFMLGFGEHLSRYLLYSEPKYQTELTLSEIIYRSHPPIQKRVERLKRMKNK